MSPDWLQLLVKGRQSYAVNARSISYEARKLGFDPYLVKCFLNEESYSEIRNNLCDKNGRVRTGQEKSVKSSISKLIARSGIVREFEIARKKSEKQFDKSQ